VIKLEVIVLWSIFGISEF